MSQWKCTLGLWSLGQYAKNIIQLVSRRRIKLASGRHKDSMKKYREKEYDLLDSPVIPVFLK